LELSAWVVIGVVVVSLLALLTMIRKRAWNVDGSDDELRPDGAKTDQD
jgi:hypothetical protein